MRISKTTSDAVRWTIRIAAVSVLLLAGCLWQRDAYTNGSGRLPGMIRTMQQWERSQQLEAMLGSEVRHAEIPIALRPLKPTALVETPPELAADTPPKCLWVFQGDTPPLEVIVAGSSGDQSLPQFQAEALAKLNATGKGPGDAAQKGDNQTIDNMYYGPMTMELYSAQAPRTLSQGAQPVVYDWFIYFFEDAPHKVMVAFIIPDAKYADYTLPMVTSLGTLAVGAKVGSAPLPPGGRAAGQ
jgi:hypothetical protein